MSSAALAARGNWQAGANQGGAAHETNVEKIFEAYFATEEGTDYEFISKPKLLDQLFLEEDYKRNPAKYAKPAEPKKDDTYYDETKKRFYRFTGKSWTEKKLGMEPDGLIRNKVTGKAHLLEDKKQNGAGNAHERACRYGMPKIAAAIRERLNIDNDAHQPVSWIFAGDMTTDEKYILEIQATFPDNHVLLVKPTDNAKEVIIAWFNRVIRPLLDDVV
jgi:hypothetical protein